PDGDGGEPREYLIPKGKHISVHEGDRVRAGEALMDGSSNPHDILKVKGPEELAKYLVDEVQEVYRLQGVRINDKHIEVIVRQMPAGTGLTKYQNIGIQIEAPEALAPGSDEDDDRPRTGSGMPSESPGLLASSGSTGDAIES